MSAADTDLHAIDFAAAVIQAGPVNPMQLQKILLFSQGFSLALFNQPLFAEEFAIPKYGSTEKSTLDVYKCSQDHSPLDCECLFSEPLTPFKPVATKFFSLLAAVRSQFIKQTNKYLSDKAHALKSWVAHSTERGRIITSDDLRTDFDEQSLKLQAFCSAAEAVHLYHAQLWSLHDDNVTCLRREAFRLALDVVVSSVESPLDESVWFELRTRLHCLTTSVADAEMMWRMCTESLQSEVQCARIIETNQLFAPKWSISAQAALLGYILLPPFLWEELRSPDATGFHSMPAKIFIHQELAKKGDIFAQFFL